jgi:hypothetical protein
VIEERFAGALTELYLGLKDSGVSWVVTASLNLALHGLPVEVHDIDVLTDEAGAYEIERRLAQHSVRAVCWRASDRIRSHFGALCLGGVAIDIMGDVETYDEVTGWQPTPEVASNSEIIELRGQPIPVRTLEAEHAAYVRLGRAEKAELVQRWLECR